MLRIDRSIITSMVSVAVTYIIVLLQFRMSIVDQQSTLNIGGQEKR